MPTALSSLPTQAPDQLLLADCELASATWAAEPGGRGLLTLRLSAAAVQRWPLGEPRPLLGFVTGVSLLLQGVQAWQPTNGSPLAALAGRLHQFSLAHPQLAPSGTSVLPLPLAPGWAAPATAATTQPPGLTLQLRTAQGESLQLPAQGVTLAWPAEALWRESWAC